MAVRGTKLRDRRQRIKHSRKRLALRIMEMDKAYAPFVMEEVEMEGLLHTVKISHAPGMATLGGKIDRVDRKGEVVRVVDYKTGKDEMNFESVESLFDRNGKRNKAAFQTFLYALLYKTKAPQGKKIIPGLISRVNLFESDTPFGLQLKKQPIDDVHPLLGDFEKHLHQLLEELYDPAIPFDQTTLLENCRLCPYRGICYR